MEVSFKWNVNPFGQLDKLRTGLRNTAMRKAINKASGRVKEAVVNGAPQRYGFLRKSIKIRVRQYKNSEVWVSVIGPKSDFKRNKGRKTRGKHKGDNRVSRPALYARLVECGTKHAKARPFLKPALEATVQAYQDTFCSKLAEEIAKLLGYTARYQSHALELWGIMAAKIGYGCILEADTGSSSAYVAIADVININFPSQDVGKVDVTSVTQSSTYKQSIPGMKEGGSMSLEVYWTAAAFASLSALLGINHNFRVTMNDATPTKYTYNGYVSKIEGMKVEADKTLSFKLDIEVLGAVTIS